MDNMNSTLITVCIVLIALGIWIGIGFLIYTLIQVRRAAMAVEMLSYNLNDNVLRMKAVTGKLLDFTTAALSMRTLEMLWGVLSGLWNGRPKARGSSPETETVSKVH
jgi:hypothetical protein